MSTSHDKMAAVPRGRDFLTRLATETLVQITSYLGEQDLFSLSLVDRRLNHVVTRPLWDGLYNDALRCKEVLLWAVERGRDELVRDLLGRGVDPNFFYVSSFIRSRLKDILAIQERHGAAGPQNDDTLKREMFREMFYRNALLRRRVHYLQKVVRDMAPIEQDLDFYVNAQLGFIGHDVPELDKFGIVERFPSLDTNKYWGWAPLHLAVIQGDNEVVRLLLEHGADPNSQCAGACDCPSMVLSGEVEPNKLVTPHRARPIWNALHLAMCSQNEDTVRLLVAHGAAVRVGARMSQNAPLGSKKRLTVTALENVAWLGSTRICRILLEERRYRQDIDRRNIRNQSALHCAAAGGAIRTVGKLLLDNGAAFFNYEDSNGQPVPAGLGHFKDIINDPLRLLCMQYRFDDAGWLLQYCRQTRPRTSTVQLYTRSLAVLCVLQPPAVYRRDSLRQLQDQIFKPSSEDQDSASIISSSKDQRLSLGKVLLGLGADPNRGEVTAVTDMPIPSKVDGVYRLIYRTPLQLAVVSGFSEMVELLVSRGADCNLAATRYTTPKELPLLLAAHGAMKRGEVGTQLVQCLIDSGASLHDHKGYSILVCLDDTRMHFPLARLDVERSWLSTAEVLLKHGVADKTSKENWDKVWRKACCPGGLKYCKLLEKWRPKENFCHPSVLIKMLTYLVEAKLPTAFPADSPSSSAMDDPEMASWVLGHAKGRSCAEFKPWHIDHLDRLVKSALEKKRLETANKIQEFINRIEAQG